MMCILLPDICTFIRLSFNKHELLIHRTKNPSSYKSYKNHCAMFALQLKNILQISNNRKVLRNFFL